MSALFAAQLPWPKLEALAKAGAFALLPVGSTEAHGPHLPLNVDVTIAEEVCRRVAMRLSAGNHLSVIFPAVPYGLTEFAAAFSGTVSLTAATGEALITEVLTGIARHGFKRIGVCNHHLEPAHFALVHQAAANARAAGSVQIAVPDHRKKPTGPRLGPEFTHGGSHAGHYETSLMLAAAPRLVDEVERAKLPELNVDLPARIKAGAKNFHDCGGPLAYLGNPAAATAEEGHRLIDILAEVSERALLDLP